MLIVEDKHYEGHGLALSSSAVMSLSMGARYIKTGSKPAGAIAALGTLSVAYHVKCSNESFYGGKIYQNWE